jgi:site-specific recombinase XerD
MRHDFASQLVMKGVDLNTVRELMGHADMKMTMRYAHLAPNLKLRAVEVLSENADHWPNRKAAVLI